MTHPLVRGSWLLAVLVLLAGCGAGAPFTFTASAPWGYSLTANPPFASMAVQVTITNLTTDDLVVNPADFVARDASHHIYPANPTEAVANAQDVQMASASRRGNQSVAPLPSVTLRQNDVLNGFVVFDVPRGTQLVDLIWRQSDTDYTVQLAATQ